MSVPIEQSRFTAAAAVGLAVGLIGLGVLSLIHHDFAFQWQPVPKDLPGRAGLAVASGVLLVVTGALLLIPRTRVWGGLVAAVFLGFWVVGLHLPLVVAKPSDVPLWLGLAEPLAMASGAFVLFREQRTGADDRDARWAMLPFGAACVVFGLSHFLFAAFTAAMIPAWLPLRLELAYLTGAIHALAGACLLIGLRRRWAAGIEAAMMSSFVLLVHLPRVAAHPANRMELTMLFVAVTLSSAAWILTTSRTLRPGRL